MDEKRSLFREFILPEPFKSIKDIFSLRDSRVVNAYHKISLRNIELTVPKVPLRERVSLRIFPCMSTGMAEIRFWYDKKLVGTAKVRNEDLNIPNL